MGTENHIPVSEETRDALQKLKEPGQTYDELLSEFIAQKRAEQLAIDVKALFERADDPVEVVAALEGGEFERALKLLDLSESEATALTTDWQQMANQLTVGDADMDAPDFDVDADAPDADADSDAPDTDTDTDGD